MVESVPFDTWNVASELEVDHPPSVAPHLPHWRAQLSRKTSEQQGDTDSPGSKKLNRAPSLSSAASFRCSGFSLGPHETIKCSAVSHAIGEGQVPDGNMCSIALDTVVTQLGQVVDLLKQQRSLQREQLQQLTQVVAKTGPSRRHKVSNTCSAASAPRTPNAEANFNCTASIGVFAQPSIRSIQAAEANLRLYARESENETRRLHSHGSTECVSQSDSDHKVHGSLSSSRSLGAFDVRTELSCREDMGKMLSCKEDFGRMLSVKEDSEEVDWQQKAVLEREANRQSMICERESQSIRELLSDGGGDIIRHSASSSWQMTNTDQVVDAFTSQSCLDDGPRKLYSTSDRLPSAMPWSIRVAFFLSGIVNPRQQAFDTWFWTEWAYRIYRIFIPIFCVALGASQIAEGYLLMFVVKEGFAVQFGWSVFCMVALPYLWTRACHQYGIRGASLALLQEMSHKGFDFKDYKGSLLVMRVAYIGLVVMDAVSFSLRSSMGTNLLQRVQDTAGGHSLAIRVTSVCYYMGRPAQYLTLLFGVHLIWLVYLTCKLHQHDLLTYARIVESAFMQDIGTADLIVLVDKLEVTLTARLRHASTAWVRWLLACCAYWGILCLSMFMYLIVAKDLMLDQVFTVAAQLVVMIAGMVAMAFPVAAVSQTFEDDVLRALNKPVNINRAKEHFGEELLSHLHTLEWGFRLGGTVINTRGVSKILFGFVVTVVTTVSQAMLQP